MWLAWHAGGAAVDPKSAMGVWLFDEGRGNETADLSGHNFTGTLNGPKWVAGKIGNALKFEGAQWVSVPSAPELVIGDELTMMAWFFAEDISTWRQIIAKSDEYLLRIDPPGEGNRMSAFVKAVGSWEPRASAFVPKTKEWIHFAATYRAKPKGDVEHLRLYVNGEPNGVSTRPGKVSGTLNPVEIGRWGGGSYFVGVIDEAAIFNAALSAEEIKTIADNGLQKVLKGGLAVRPAGNLATQWARLKR
jgi:hypothetical protein